MKKIYTFTGAKGSGKSTAVARMPRPSEIHRMVIVDTEDSMSNILDNNAKMSIKFGAYIRMYNRLSKKDTQSILSAMAEGNLPWIRKEVKASVLIDYYQYFIDQLAETLEKGDRDGEPFRFLGIDTIEPIEAGVRAYVEYKGPLAGWSRDRSYGKPEVEGVRPILEGIFEGVDELGIKEIAIASHLKPVWEGKGKDVRRVTNKVQVGGRIVVWSRISSMMWWLMPGVGNSDGAPAGLRLKARYADEQIDHDADEWITREMLPPRIPHFTWKDVRWYQEHGWNSDAPRPGEMLTKDEFQMMSEFLTDEQLKLMVLGAEADLLDRQQQAGGGLVVQAKKINVMDKVNEAKVKTMLAEGKSNAEIVKETGASLPVVMKLKSELK